MINGVVAQKLQMLDQILTELRSLGTVDAAELSSDWRTRRAVERDLQVLVEIVVDICQRLISVAGQAPAATSADAIERCIQLGVLADDAFFRQMVQFRNVILYRYEQVDVKILVDIVNHRLTDFERFRDDVLAYVKTN
jgi:uncharacterized protein YutE (UPF0331/DUF86 family)